MESGTTELESGIQYTESGIQNPSLSGIPLHGARHEKAIITTLDVIDGKEQREHAAQLEHFQISMNQLQKHVEWCQGILQRKKSVQILKEHHALIGWCRGLLRAEKRNIYKPSHVRYQINEEHVSIVRSAAPMVGRIVVSSTDPLQSVAEGTGLREGKVGSEATITIKTKDFDEKQCYDKNDQIQVIVQSPSKEIVRHMIECEEDGDYSVTYTPDCVGQHEVQIAVNGQSLTSSPWHVHVTPYHYKYSFSFGSLGKGRGQLDWPNSLSSDGSRLLHIINDPGCANPRFALCHQKIIFVSYYLESDVKVFSKNRKFLHSIWNPESGCQQTSVPAGFAIDKFSNLVVCDRLEI